VYLPDDPYLLESGAVEAGFGRIREWQKENVGAQWEISVRREALNYQFSAPVSGCATGAMPHDELTV
jgi:hypothetical protein